MKSLKKKENCETEEVKPDKMEEKKNLCTLLELSYAQKLVITGYLFLVGMLVMLIGVISFITDRVLQHFSVHQSVIAFLAGLLIIGMSGGLLCQKVGE